MKLCRFETGDKIARIGLLSGENAVIDLPHAGVAGLSQILDMDDPLPQLQNFAREPLPKIPLSQVRLLPPLERQEVWAVGVTYLRSKKARMEESDFSANAYDKVYEAARPELFFKALPEKVVGPGDAVGIRRDGKWNVPEPELVFVLNSRGHL